MIRLRRIGQERKSRHYLFGGTEETKGDFDRIFQDSGIEFANFDAKESISTRNKIVTSEPNRDVQTPSVDGDPHNINQNEI